MSGPSKYDSVVRWLVGTLDAEAAIVFVVGGTIGSGFARAEMPKADPEEMQAMRMAMAKTLRIVADDIERGITQPDQPEHRRGSA